MIASVLDFVPCGNSVPVLKTDCAKTALELVACLNSFLFDFALRCRMYRATTSITFSVGEMPLPPKLIVANHPEIAEMADSLEFESEAILIYMAQADRTIFAAQRQFPTDLDQLLIASSPGACALGCVARSHLWFELR